jgi:ribosomal-protein-alanine N-acetyltransferase
MKNRNIPADTILMTGRLLLRYPQLDDAAPIFAVVSSAQFPEQLPLKEIDAESGIEGWLKRLQAGWTAGAVFSWILEDRETGQMLGQVTLSRVEGDKRWALAFWIHPDHWGEGYATEGVERLLAFGFEQLEAGEIWAGAGDWNKASCRVLEKIGMHYVGDNPRGYTSKGEPIRTRDYRISSEGWQKQHQTS